MSIYTLRSGVTAHPEDSVIQIITDLIRIGGVRDLSSTNHFKVTERDAGANMSVDIAIGRCVVKGAGNAYPVRNTDAINKAVGSNTSGNPRKDAVVVYIDLSASPDSTGSNVAKTEVVQGTPAASPAAPDNAAILTAIGGSNPYLVLAHVTVANNETTIEDADISDQRVQFRTVGTLKEGTVSFSATPEFDVSDENYKDITLTGNVTSSSVKGDQVGVPFTIKTIQGGAGGYTFAWWANIDWFGGTPVLSATAGEVDAFGFIKKENGRYDGFVLGRGGSTS